MHETPGPHTLFVTPFAPQEEAHMSCAVQEGSSLGLSLVLRSLLPRAAKRPVTSLNSAWVQCEARVQLRSFAVSPEHWRTHLSQNLLEQCPTERLLSLLMSVPFMLPGDKPFKHASCLSNHVKPAEKMAPKRPPALRKTVRAYERSQLGNIAWGLKNKK